MKITLQELLQQMNKPEIMKNLTELRAKMQDNLFSANHRFHMVEKYGATGADWVTIEDLLKN